MKLAFSLFALASLYAQRCFSAPGPMAANEMFATDPGFSGAKANEVYAANDGDIHRARENLAKGIVYEGVEAANDGNLLASPLGLSRPLTEKIIGVEDTDPLEQILERIAPRSPVGSIAFTYLVETASQQGQKREIQEIERPIGGEFPTVALSGSEDNGRCKNIGLVSYIDIDQGGLLPMMQNLEVKRLKGILLRTQIADALAKIDAAASDESASNWGLSTSDPDSDIDEMVDNGGRASGIDNNLVIFGRGAFMKRRKAYRQPARTNGGEHAILTPEMLRDIYQVDDVINLRSLYRSSQTAHTAMLDNKVYTLDARRDVSPKDSSNIKRFTYVDANGGMRVWVEVQSHRVKIIVDAHAVTEITRTVGIRKRTVSYS